MLGDRRPAGVGCQRRPANCLRKSPAVPYTPVGEATRTLFAGENILRDLDMPFQPTNQQIADILSHIRYEIDQILVVPLHDGNDWRIRESVFLAMLVHGRLLLDFFEHTARERDDVLCADFGFEPAKIPLSPHNRARLNKDIAHLTYSRLRHRRDGKAWPVEDILRPIRQRAAKFAAHIVNNPPANISEKEIARWKELHQVLNGAEGNPLPATSPNLGFSTNSSNTAAPISIPFEAHPQRRSTSGPRPNDGPSTHS